MMVYGAKTAKEECEHLLLHLLDELLPHGLLVQPHLLNNERLSLYLTGHLSL